MSNHTPTPWHVFLIGSKGLPHIRNADGLYVMDAAPRGSLARSKTRQLADAEHIVRCVNLHDELVALLVELIDIEGPQPGTAAWADKVRKAIDKARFA